MFIGIIIIAVIIFVIVKKKQNGELGGGKTPKSGPWAKIAELEQADFTQEALDAFALEEVDILGDFKVAFNGFMISKIEKYKQNNKEMTYKTTRISKTVILTNGKELFVYTSHVSATNPSYSSVEKHEFPIRNVNSVQSEKQLLNSELTITSGSKKIKLNVENDEVSKAAERAINKMVRNAKK